MFYYLFRDLLSDLPGAGLFTYVSFRAPITFITSIIISMVIGKHIIKYLQKKQIGESIRDLGLEGQMSKKGTPTMGGIIIILSILVSVLLVCDLSNIYVQLLILTTVWCGALGFADDYIKMKITKDGLRPIYKLLGQAALGLIIGLTLWASPDAVIRENVSYEKQETEVVIHKSDPVKSTITTIPFVKNNNLNYSELFSWLGDYKNAAGWVFFVFLPTFVVMAVSNGSNLNDGMDGMCAGNSAIIGVALGILAYVSSHIGYASYFNIMYIPESQELVIFICTMAYCCKS